MPPKGSGHGWGKAGNPEKAALRARVWRALNQDKLKFIQWANAANMRYAPGRTSYADLVALKADRDECRYCRAPIEELDHILPVRRGGTNYPWNLQFLCHACNRCKAQRYPIEFETEYGFVGSSWLLLFQAINKCASKYNFVCE